MSNLPKLKEAHRCIHREIDACIEKREGRCIKERNHQQ